MIEMVEKISWMFEDEIFDAQCFFRRSAKAKRISLKVPEPGKVILTIPRWASEVKGREFLYKSRDWIRKKSSALQPVKTLKQYFDQPREVWLDSTPREFIWSVNEKNKHTIREIDRDQVRVEFPIDFDPEVHLLKEFMQMGRRFLPIRLENCEKKSGLRSKKCRIGNQRSRWGSCSGKGTISLNWRILLLPFELGEYVLYHELTHLEQMNHSVCFWEALERFIPEAKKVDKQLNSVGKEIIFIGHNLAWNQ